MFIETPYQNMMLDRQFLRTEERLMGAHVISTTSYGMAGHMDLGFLEKAQL
jgi:hypothetical protein